MQDWLFRLQEDFLSRERRRYYTINIPNELTGSEARRQVDLIIKQKSGEPSDSEHDWRDIEVVGKLKASNSNGIKKTLVQLACYARDVFACQPTRRYLHVFTICGRVMEVWVFDRSGCYSPGPFDIHNEPERFVQVITGYLMMNEDELGLDTFTEQDGNSRFINIEQEGAEINRVQLRPEPLTCQQAIVCRGTSCYLTKSPYAPESDNWSYITKFSWTSDRRKPEADLLRLANQKGVKGIATLVGHWSITSIKEMRSGMTFTKPYSFRGTPRAPPSALSRSFSDLNDLTTAETTGERPLRKRKSADAGTKSSKGSRSTSHRSGPRNEVTYDVEEAQGTSLLVPSNSPYDNQIFRCLVIYPAGRPIHKYETPLELLEALHDALKTHRSLYMDGNILHQDISENNIIITDSKKTGFAGMLIDMDLAEELGGRRSGARCRTGTMEFMAIEVLLSIDHTYRHDLESFFYVLLWQCGRRGWNLGRNLIGQPRSSLLTNWYTGSYEDIAIAKQGSVEADIFEVILATEFPPVFDCVKPLCRELRGILFPVRGTPKDPEILYGPIIKAFDKAIDSIKGRE
uniref:non-specific serine/threonine protein kinase n=1 Tax=Coccidioides posadasii RMSCC 3488 TaxID=454284 RepID=A0A0J6FRK5_COCPO|nr:hypothetical protein CPAG_07967 [Coccidioides posadasii RMSCC 3488]